MFGSNESGATEASLGAPRALDQAVSSQPTPASPNSSIPTVARTALEEGQRIEREELVSDILRMRWLSAAAAVVWAAFAIDDWMIASFDPHVHLGQFFAIRGVGLLAVLYFVYRLRTKRKMTRLSYTIHDIGIFAVIQTALSIMCIQYEGIASPLVTGILVVLIARASILAYHWKRGLAFLGIPLLAFPCVLVSASLFSPQIREQFQDTHARAVFMRHLFVLGAALGVCVWGGHGNWALRRQLFEARNVGRYRLKHRIGRGGMGEVWVAYHSGLQRDIALKILRPDSETDPIAVQRFEQEVAATSRLTHPNTVRVFDYGVTDDGIWYYAMELLDGMTLYDLVHKDGPVTLTRALLIAHQVARALAEAHTRGIVHRDVKPENIFVTRAGDEPDFVKVLDFGIAKVRGEARGSTLTQTGAVFGTPAYISPEAAQGKVTSSRSDVYGVGAVLYFMLAGRPPFVAASPAEVLLAHITQPAPTLDSLNVKVPAPVSALVMRCLEKDPEKRYGDASALATELAELVIAHRAASAA
jgi:serine/threonine-protein kinase